VKFVNFDLSETQELFRSTTDRFTQDIDVPARLEIRENELGYCKARWVELCELGLLAVALPEAQGGLNGSIIDLTVIAESLGKNNALDPWMENGIFPISLLSKAKSKAPHTLDSQLLESLLNGSKIGAVAFSEPNMRYSLDPISTTAIASNNGFSLNGQKQFIMGGALADYLLVTATYEGEFSLFLVPAGNDGIETKTYRLADGSNATSIVLTDCVVDSESLIGIDFAQFRDTTIEMASLCCAEMAGLSHLLLEQTVDYVKEREQFGVAIGSFQVVQHGLVDCYSQVEQIKAMLLSLQLQNRDSDDQWRGEVMGAKSFISDAAIYVAEWAVQYHGAMGTTDELCIGHAMKRIITLSRLFGDSGYSLNQYLECA